MKSIYKTLIGLSMVTAVAVQAEAGGTLNIDPLYLHVRESITTEAVEAKDGETKEEKAKEETKKETNNTDSNYLGVRVAGDYTFENSWKVKGSVVASIKNLDSKKSDSKVENKDQEAKDKNEKDLHVASSSFAIGREFIMNDQMTVTPLVGVNSFVVGESSKLKHLDDKKNEVSETLYNARSYAGPFAGVDITYLVDAWKIVGEASYTVTDTYRSEHNFDAKTISTDYNNKNLAHGPTVALSLQREIADSWTASVGSEYRYLYVSSNHTISQIDAKVGLNYQF